MAPNPSHLEFVNPVVAGMARAAGTSVDGPGPVALRPEAHAADPDPRRRRVPRPGHRRRDAEPRAPRRLRHRRHDPRHRQQPARLHRDAAASPTARRTRAAWRAASRSRSSTSTPTTRSPASRRRGWPSAYRAHVPDGLPDRPGRLSPLRAQRGRRAELHAAAALRQGRRASDGARRSGPITSSRAARHRRRGRGAAAQALHRARGGARVAQAGARLRRADPGAAAARRGAPGEDGGAARAAARR